MSENKKPITIETNNRPGMSDKDTFEIKGDYKFGVEPDNPQPNGDDMNRSEYEKAFPVPDGLAFFPQKESLNGGIYVPLNPANMNDSYKHDFGLKVWNSRQHEIDSLRAEVERLKEAQRSPNE